MKQTRQIMVGDIPMGGGAPIVIQSMCSADTRDVPAVMAQIHALAESGCELCRLAVPDGEAADALHRIVKQSPLPIVADIHFDARLALASLKAGVQKLRINPGNIGSADQVRTVALAAKERGVPIRIGVNGGSVKPALLAKYGLTEAMTRSAMDELALLESVGFHDVCLSLKASNVKDTVAANRRIHEMTDCPLHLGVTEAGTLYHGIVKNTAAMGALLCDGIGDTLRVSLTADPVEEIRAAKAILRALGLRREGVEIISCPTCGRCRIPVEALAAQVEQRLSHIKKPLRVAVMGCGVNGPGEAREADIGIAGGDGVALLFCGGESVRKVNEEEIVEVLCAEVQKLCGEEHP